MTSSTSQSHHVLLVEDVLVNRRVAAAFLTRQGYRVSEAVTGGEALDMSAAERFDLILLDIRLPDMDGVDVASRIRAFPDPLRAQVPILALTANVFPDDIKRYRAAGMNGVVAKPIQLEQFRMAVTSVLQSTPVVVSVDSGGTSALRGDEAALDEDFIAERLRTLGRSTFDTILQLGKRSIAGAVADVAATCDQGEQAPLALAKAAHRLAGAASNFGFRGLFLLGQKIETLADPRDGGKPQGQAAATAAATVPMVYEQTLQELDSWLARLPPV
ncbi:response regulator [Insolitispirillum peregrinum]|uniref:response regulator n=1 Tax=Insolitispirillum peregrinum TaxID=80876 RepID=UPI00360C2D9D